ncbi:hypothetical protein D1AOALGA4SA_8183 [Olavius algarvensis Delta 1 endosymbiont]|nr:hypothetical protein D1AOALGA4SA_8183 [Olavius algarvensis Delta 1 endosymbiont]
METRINVTQVCLDDNERKRNWEEDRRHPLDYFKNRFQWYHYPLWQYVAPFPLHVDFETSSKCNLSCPMCFRRHFENEHVYADMDIELFKKGIEECADNNLYSIRLSWRGECTLNIELFNMISYAKAAGIKEVSFLSNGSFLDRDSILSLIESGLDYITISIDGLGKSYNQLRAPLEFNNTFENVKGLYALKEKIGNGYPKVKIQGIYEYTEGDMVEYYNKFRPVSDNISFNTRHDYSLTQTKQDDNLFCPYLWQRITVSASGDIPLCISDWDLNVTLGNLNLKSIKEIWHSERINKIRELHLENRRLEIKPCLTCIRNHVAAIEKKM